MILVLGGTTEANQITKTLCEKNQKVIVSCTTPEGAGIAQNIDRERVNTVCGKMNKDELTGLLKSYNFKSVIDATHPFAQIITSDAIKACKAASVPYHRFERKPYNENNNRAVLPCNNFEEASKAAYSLGKRIFLTIGVNNINQFTKRAASCNKEIFTRILDQKSSLKKCKEVLIAKENIIMAKGPFSTAQNIAHFKKYSADVVVSKDSGINGGLKEKIEACNELNLPLVLIKRPDFQQNAFYEIEELIKEALI